MNIDLALALLLCTVPNVCSLYRLEEESSSFVVRQENSIIEGHVIQTRTVSNFITCAQHCLVQTKCKSVNYKSKGVCEMNDVAPGGDAARVVSEDRVVLGWWRDVAVEEFVFTPLGGSGAGGPTNVSGYNETNLQGKVRLVNGIQVWSVPESGNYLIEAFGASGSKGTCLACKGWSLGGKGAKISGTFPLKKATQLRIIVGQQGLRSSDTPQSPGGGGGGTFVSAENNTPLIVAGGGGGGGIPVLNQDGDPGQISNNGSRYGGSEGDGGRRYDVSKNSYCPKHFPCFAGSGAGFYKNSDSFGGIGALGFTNGGTGGKGNAEGGFGGGGFPFGQCPGGGGGYSGGGVIVDNINGGTAEGGGSYNNGFDQTNEIGSRGGDGRITITLLK